MNPALFGDLMESPNHNQEVLGLMYLSVFPIIVIVAGSLFLGITSCDQLRSSGDANVQPKCHAKWYDEVSKDSRCLELQKQLTDRVVEGDPQRVRESINRGANVNGGFDQSIPVLEGAAALGKTEVVRLLIDAGADVNRVRPLGQTALKAAVTRRHVETTKVLIEKGANVCEKTESSALQYATESADKELIALLEEAGAKSCS